MWHTYRGWLLLNKLFLSDRRGRLQFGQRRKVVGLRLLRRTPHATSGELTLVQCSLARLLWNILNII